MLFQTVAHEVNVAAEDSLKLWHETTGHIKACIYRPARYEVNIADLVTPQTYEQAMNSPQSKEWKAAIEEELDSLEKKYDLGTRSITRRK